MKRIVVLCDGTWNSPDMKDTTHVDDLKRALAVDANQVVLYIAGNGVASEEKYRSRLSRMFKRTIGGATAYDMEAKVKALYRAVAEHYDAGDELYLFGFSRGAFMARSLVGMIRKCGLVADAGKATLDAAFELYRLGGAENHPDAEHIQAARAEMSPDFATSEVDLHRRGGSASMVNIVYMGLWDTVGARGLPEALFGIVARLWNQQYEFHDLALSSLVRSARHAIAADERRIFYRHVPWDNLGKLNAGDQSDGRAYQQCWFTGDHPIVGGSAECDPLSVLTRSWVIEGAPRLTWRDGRALDDAGADPMCATDRLNNPSLIYQIKTSWFGWRDDPRDADQAHDSALARISGDSGYRPHPLRRWFP